jgi:ribosomal protein S19E (S16A)
MDMDDKKINALIDAFAQKKKQAEDIAQMKAMDFVKSNNQDERVRSQQYLSEAELWREASEMLRKCRVGAA